MIKQYEQKIKEQQKYIKSNEMISTWIGLIKLGLLLLTLFALYKAITMVNLYMYIALVAVIFYIIFALWQSYVKRKIEVSNNAIIIYQKHIDRMTGDWIQFEDTGIEYLQEDHLYASDLDIIGNKSLFQFLNLTNTYHGRKQFIKDLLAPNYKKEEIMNRQLAIYELSNNIDFINDLEQKTIEIGTNDRILKIIDILRTENTIPLSRSIQNSMYITPIIATVSFVTGLYLKILPMVIVGFGLLIIQGFMWILSLARLQTTLQRIRKVPFNLKEYTDIFAYITKQDFSSTTLNIIKSNLSSDTQSASHAMKDLDTIISMISVGNNFIIYGLLNIFCLWDFHCYIRFKKWQKRYARTCESWFNSLGELESLMSFSILPMVCAHTCMPKIIEDKKKIIVKQLGHPLLPYEKRVNNDISLVNSICIISGSNMSGKTTFMRTIGINLLLTKVGSFVCAKEMEATTFNLVSSMRIADNLNEGISTFYAELKKIKSILDVAKEDTSTFFMIDEIFRGTNSVDRLEGAQIVLKKLHELGIMGVITTHDLELCQMEKQYTNVYNYHFSESYHNNEIIFDYLLQSGVSTTTNAKELMKMLGIM